MTLADFAALSPDPASRWGGGRAMRFRALILERDGARCRMLRDGAVCGDPATTVDHIVPRSRGGAAYDPANARAACADCNYRAGGRLSSNAVVPDGLTAYQAGLVQLMDEWNLPRDAGSRFVRSVLARAGVTQLPGAGSLDVACRWRRGTFSDAE